MSGILVPKPMLGRQLPAGHARDIVGLWLFNEGSGNIVQDLSGNGKTGTLVGDTNWVPGKFGSALSFDGDGDYVAVGDVGDNTTFLTISIWAKPTTGQAAYLVAKDDLTNRSFNLGISATGQIEVFIDTVSGYDYGFTGEDTYIGGEWSHFLLTYSDGITKAYINGQEATVTFGGGDNNAEGAINNNSLSTDVGRRANSGSEGYFDGLIDHVIIWNRALSASEIAELYLNPFIMFDREPLPLWTAATSVGVPPVGMAGAMTTNTGYWGW